MAIKACVECGAEISSSAKTCPHCGRKDPTTTRADKIAGFIVLVGIVAGVIYYLNQPATSTTATPSPCATDWRKCTDNTEMANTYMSWSDVRTGCKYAANDQAKYGSPSWPWLSFSSFQRGADYPKTGLATAIEPDAQFQNQYGALVHSRVVCVYDLTAQQKPPSRNVRSITIIPRD